MSELHSDSFDPSDMVEGLIEDARWTLRSEALGRPSIPGGAKGGGFGPFLLLLVGPNSGLFF